MCECIPCTCVCMQVCVCVLLYKHQVHVDTSLCLYHTEGSSTYVYNPTFFAVVQSFCADSAKESCMALHNMPVFIHVEVHMASTNVSPGCCCCCCHHPCHPIVTIPLSPSTIPLSPSHCHHPIVIIPIIPLSPSPPSHCHHPIVTIPTIPLSPSSHHPIITIIPVLYFCTFYTPSPPFSALPSLPSLTSLPLFSLPSYTLFPSPSPPPFPPPHPPTSGILQRHLVVQETCKSTEWVLLEVLRRANNGLTGTQRSREDHHYVRVAV